MPRMDIAVPILPARDLDESIEFYGRLGFQLVYRHPELKDYVIVRRAKLELHLFHWPQLDTQTTFAGAYLRVKDVDELYEAFSTARLPARGPRAWRASSAAPGGCANSIWSTAAAICCEWANRSRSPRRVWQAEGAEIPFCPCFQRVRTRSGEKPVVSCS